MAGGGKGHYAVVRRCREKCSATEYAAKFIRKRRTASSRRGAPQASIEQEVRLLSMMSHENIVSLHQVFSSATHVILVMELVRGGELFEFVTDKERLSEAEASCFIKQILLGLAHMHSKSIAHLDLKPENVMLLSRNQPRLKLIDFGLSRVIRDGDEDREMIGTPEFVSPEIVNYEPLCLACDMWAVGVITYILLSGASPFLGDTEQETYANITACDFHFDEEFFSNTSDAAKDFISRLFIRDPRRRATVKECLSHHWIQPPSDRDLTERQEKEVNIEHLKAYQARRRWKHSLRVVTFCNRLSRSAKLRSRAQSLEMLDEGVPITDGSAGDLRAAVEKDENFVASALFCAAEEGNIAGIKRLFAMAKIDPNACNKQGETAVHVAAGAGQLEVIRVLRANSAALEKPDERGDAALAWAARQGHSAVLEYLTSEGAYLNRQNLAGETALIIACKYGHLAAVRQLLQAGVSLDIQDNHGETALHAAVWHDFPEIACLLCQAGATPLLANGDRETALHYAVSRGHLVVVEALLGAGARPDSPDVSGVTPLHWALRRRHLAAAHRLLEAGANCDAADATGDRPIHLSSEQGLVTVVRALCGLHCAVDIPNRHGLYPIHLAARSGHTEVVNVLCLAGCTVDQRDRTGHMPEFVALQHGHLDTGCLLSKIRDKQQRDFYVSQLTPSTTAISRVKIKLLGSSGSGKTTLVNSLTSGYLSSLFKRSRGSSFRNTTRKKTALGVGSCPSDVARSDPGETPIDWDAHSAGFTRGINITQASVSGLGDVSLWDFSSHAGYHLTHGTFLGSAACVHLVLFRLTDPAPAQLRQWLSLIQAHVRPTLPLGHCGRPARCGRVALVGTHPDLSNCQRNAHGEYVCPEAEAVLREVQQTFGQALDIHGSVFLLDATSASSSGLKQLKLYLYRTKASLLQGLPKSTGLLPALASQVLSWRRILPHFPVMTWTDLAEVVRDQVNPLAQPEHLQQAVEQLQLQGEVVQLNPTTAEDALLVFGPSWLCRDILGLMLSPEFVRQTKRSGRYTVEEFQTLMPSCDALDLLQVLETLHLCAQCEGESDLKFEFPCYFREGPPPDTWEMADPASLCYGGLLLRRAPETAGQPLPSLLPRLQVYLRRFTNENACDDWELHQWSTGSLLRTDLLEAMLSRTGDSLELKLRGPVESGAECFWLMEDLMAVFERVMNDESCHLVAERHYICPEDLRYPDRQRRAYPQAAILARLLQLQDPLAHFSSSPLPDNTSSSASTSSTSSSSEDVLAAHAFIRDVVCFGSSAVQNQLVFTPDLPLSVLSVSAVQRLCAALDPADPLGRDWCLLAVRLGLTERLSKLDAGEDPAASRTARLLQESAAAGLTLDRLYAALRALGRPEVAEALAETAPLFRPLRRDVDGLAEGEEKAEPRSASASAASSSNASR